MSRSALVLPQQAVDDEIERGANAMLIVKKMGRHPLLVAALLTAPALAQQTSSPAKPSEPIWSWSKQCDTRRELGVSIRLKNKILYEDVIPICLGDHGAKDGHVEFHISGNQLFEGELRTHPNDVLQGEIWEIAGDADGLTLGISFANSKQVLKKTTHTARMDRKTSTEIDKDLIVSTYPHYPH